MMNSSAIRIAIAATVLALVNSASAQNADPKTLAKPGVNAASCADIQWQKQLVARYPNIAAGCQEVVVSNENRFARFTGELEQVNRDGSVRIDFKDRDGHSLGKPTMLQPAPSQRVVIEGHRYRFSELSPGQQLSVYIPEATLGVATEPVLAPESMAKLVPDEAGTPAETPQATPRLAQVTPAPAAAPAARLPDTAGWSALLGLSGIAALIGGILLTARRRLRKHELA